MIMSPFRNLEMSPKITTSDEVCDERGNSNDQAGFKETEGLR